jgi:hypothetical protein
MPRTIDCTARHAAWHGFKKSESKNVFFVFSLFIFFCFSFYLHTEKPKESYIADQARAYYITQMRKRSVTKPSGRPGGRVVVTLRRSNRLHKKWEVIVGRKHVHFGDNRYQDFTQHKTPGRKANYLSRHARHERWGKAGMASAGFWSRHLLWNKPTLNGSVRDIEQKFGIKIVKKR